MPACRRAALKASLPCIVPRAAQNFLPSAMIKKHLIGYNLIRYFSGGSATDIELKLLIGMHRCVNALDRKTARLAAAEKLTIGQFSVLEVLYSKGDLPVGAVRDSILSSVGTISVIISNLEARGLIERLPDPSDRRVCRLHLTPAGLQVIERVLPENIAMIRGAFSALTESEQQTMLTLLKKLGGKHNG